MGRRPAGRCAKGDAGTLRPSGFGWTANILLARWLISFFDPALTLWQYDRQGLTPCALADMAAYR